MKTEKDFGGYWLKNVKSHKGHEGEPLVQASVYKDGKRIGFYSDGDWGGPPNLMEFKKENEAAFTEYCKTISDFKYEPWAAVVYGILDAIDYQKWVKRQSKKKTLFRVKGDAADSYRTIGAPYLGNEEKIDSILSKKYGEGVELVLPLN